VQRTRRLRPAFGNRPSLGGGETGPLSLPRGIRVDVEEPTEYPKIGLMEDKRGSFPKAIIQPVLEVVLGSP
jgi:hypothetical protein